MISGLQQQLSGLVQAARHRLAGTARWRLLTVAAAVVLAIGIALLPAPAGVPAKAMTALGLTTATVLLWATVAVPQPYTAIAFLMAVLATGAGSPATIASGFGSSTLLLVFGGLLIGLAAERSGFGRFIAQRFFGRFRSSYGQLALGVIVGTTILSFFVPANMGRLAITIPVIMALAAEVGYPRGSPGQIGLVLIGVVGNFTVALAILPANLLNIMVVGTGEALYGVHVSYLEYLILCAPVLGFVKAVLVWWTVTRMYAAPAPVMESTAPATLGPEATRVAAILAVTIALWSTDVVHGIRPGQVALIAGAACLLPGIGVLKLADAFDARKVLILVWVGTVLTLSAVLTESGASQLLSGLLTSLAGVSGQPPIYGHLAITALTAALTSVATIGGAVPVMVAAAGDIAKATGLPLLPAILSVTSGMSVLAFPFVAAPLAVGLTMGQVSAGEATRFMLRLAGLSVLIVVPLNALWWRILGFVP
ncbi:MAG: SLC13 family permease [Hyphomicrobiaceae bacterium]|jgi:di/tricarboxylate transporter